MVTFTVRCKKVLIDNVPSKNWGYQTWKRSDQLNDNTGQIVYITGGEIQESQTANSPFQVYTTPDFPQAAAIKGFCCKQSIPE